MGVRLDSRHRLSRSRHRPRIRAEGLGTKTFGHVENEPQSAAEIADCDPERGWEQTNLENPAGRGESNRDGAAR